jgi:hypothetical protein
MEINGMAHVVLTVSNFETVVPFYEKLLAFLGMKRVFKGEEFLYYVGGRTALGSPKAMTVIVKSSLSRAGWVCIISVFAHANAATSTASMVSCRSWAPRSFTPPRTARGLRAITG